MAKNALISPFIKWVGGKRQLLEQLKSHLPSHLNKNLYVEPFIGGGALFLNLQPKKGIINDSNSELINAYLAIKNNVDALIEDLKKHINDSEYFYEIRGLDRVDDFNNLSDVERASRLIYLNKTCFNGLYRVNNSGEFNAPFGKYKNPNIVNEPVLRALSNYFNNSQIEIVNKDYAEVLAELPSNSFTYLDPPYHPLTSSANFTGYVQGGWKEADQIRLKETCDLLDKRGVKFLLSNSSTDFIKELYNNYHIVTVKAIRSVNSDAEKRGEIDELLIKNYE